MWKESERGRSDHQTLHEGEKTPKNEIQLHEDAPWTRRRGERTGSRVEEAGEQAGSTDRIGMGNIDLEALYSDVSFMDKQS